MNDSAPFSKTIGPDTRDSRGRLTFLDWTRGLAVATMLQGHVFHSFSRNDLRTDGPYIMSQFFGGVGPAVFLVLTGITLAFLMDRGSRQELPPRQRYFAALRRAGYLFTLAFLFRLQLWAFAAGQSPWTDLLKVDVLNCMGFSIAIMSAMALFTTAERVRLCAVLGVVIAAASPIISAVNWTWLPPEVYNYFVPNLNYFAFFPWAAFIAFGISIGSLFRLTKAEELSRVMQWVCLGGFGLLLGGNYLSSLPYSIYPKSDFWLNSPLLILMKLGAVLIVMAFAFVWNEYGVKGSWSWIRQLGTTSLLVYWVHVELVYGRWFGPWKESLTTPYVVVAAAMLILAMLGLSILRTRWGKMNWSAWLAPGWSTAPRSASGD
ncbi:MAG: DUF1624 domain-containing protein [Acidobacteriaceae bacterium]|nr:DUF1624 domain-containing protein [Acidobacteriaceae bacterium]